MFTFSSTAAKGALATGRWFLGGGWKWAAIALSLAVAAFTTFQVRKARSENAALSERLQAAQGEIDLLREARAADAAAIADNRSRRAETDEYQGRKFEELQEALGANRDWADQPVPADVIDSLHDD